MYIKLLLLTSKETWFGPPLFGAGDATGDEGWNAAIKSNQAYLVDSQIGSGQFSVTKLCHWLSG